MPEPAPAEPAPAEPAPADGEIPAAPGREDPFAVLTERAVAEHVAVFESEHARLKRELGAIDQL